MPVQVQESGGGKLPGNKQAGGSSLQRVPAGRQRLAGGGRVAANNRKGENMFKSFFQSEEGATATEYAVMLALIIIVCIGAITALGGKVRDIFTSVEGALPTS